MEKNKPYTFAAGIVTFNPNIERLKQNMEAIWQNESIDYLIIIDNHSDNIIDIQQLVGNNPAITLVCLSENKGIAFALNQICQRAMNMGYAWAITLDQDSIFERKAIDTFLSFTQIKDVGIICPRIEDRNMGTQYAKTTQGHEYIERCITSGNLVNLNSWQAVGGYSEEMFIDGVDFDYCLKLQEAGYRILRNNATCLIQEIGHGQKGYILGHAFSILNHSPIRLYYMTRNYLYIGQKHSQMRHWTIEVIKRIFIILKYEQNRKEKMKYAFWGLQDFLRHKMGPIRHQS